MNTTIILRSSPLPITVVSRVDECLHYGSLGYVSLQDDTGKIHHFVHIHRDIETVVGSLEALPRICVEEAKARKEAMADALVAAG